MKRWAALQRPSTCPKLSQNRSGRSEKGDKSRGENRENKLAFLDPAKAPPKSKVLPTQSLSRQRHAFIRMLVGCVPHGETVVTTWSTHNDVP